MTVKSIFRRKPKAARPAFSVVVIAKNEAKNLLRLGLHLKEFRERGGEMILLDTGSTDATAKVARGFGFHVVKVGAKFMRPVCAEDVLAINEKFVVEGEEPVITLGFAYFDYTPARNYVASLASSPYIVLFDADEAPTRFDIDRLGLMFLAGAKRISFHYVDSHYPDGRPECQFVTNTRIYDKRAYCWAGVIHETMEGEGSVVFADPSILTIEHWRTPSANRDGYLATLAVACHREPMNDRNLHYFGRELMYRGRYRSAIEVLGKHADMPSAYDMERDQSMLFIGDCYAALGADIRAKSYWGAMAYESCGLVRREPFMRLADYFCRKKDWVRVAAFAQAALQVPHRGFYGDTMANYQDLPHQYLYAAYYQLGDKALAKTHWLKALSYAPTKAEILADAKWFPADPQETKDNLPA